MSTIKRILPLRKFLLQPIPELSPEQVVRIQLNALRNNDDQDSGIEAAYAFASPANRRSTGPLARFIRMVKNPLYQPMLNYKTVEIGPLRLFNEIAQLKVVLTTTDGEQIAYIFTLSRQDYGEYMGCWMTDAVHLGADVTDE
ncbi:MAG: DUF4864 domain-containing protein [Acidobacteriota bacterium]